MCLAVILDLGENKMRFKLTLAVLMICGGLAALLVNFEIVGRPAAIWFVVVPTFLAFLFDLFSHHLILLWYGNQMLVDEVVKNVREVVVDQDAGRS